ncbi:hypothetical protein IC582_001736 [Cucumis melo]
MLKYLLRDKSANSIRGNTYPQVPPCHRGPTSPFPKDSLRFAPQAFSLAVEIFLYLLHCISLIGYRTSNVHWQTYHGDCNYFFTQALILSSQISILLLSFFSRGRGRSWSKGGVCGAELGRKNRERGAEEQEQGTVWSENRAKAWSGS